MADEVITMYAGRAVEYGTAEQVISGPLHPYTRGLMRSMPAVDSDLAAEPIGGYPPSLSALPPGCSFHPRCTLAEDRCRSGGAPQLAPVDGRRVACPVIVEQLAATGGAS